MWDLIRRLPALLQAIGVIVGIAVVMGGCVLVAFLVLGDSYRGISLGPGGIQVTARQDPDVAKRQAAAKLLGDSLVAVTGMIATLTTRETSGATEGASLRLKYLDDRKAEPSGHGWVNRQRYSSFLPKAVTEVGQIAGDRGTALKQQAALVAEIKEIDRACGVPANTG